MLHAVSFAIPARRRCGALFLRGASAPLAIGVRRPAHGAQLMAFAFASQAARCGFAVISGLDRVAPVSNTNLAHRILNSGGFLASEYPPGVPARNLRFVERNNVIAALSRESEAL